VGEIISQLTAQIESDPATRRAVIAQATHDALGRAPTDDEVRAASARKPADTYTALVQRHLRALRDNPGEYAKVIQRAYPHVIQREVYPEEIEYWTKHGTLPYALLVGCIENWARRNQPGLMVTAGTPTISINSEFLATVRLSPAVAAEARAAIGLAPAADASGDGHHLVAAGADSIVSAGRVHFAAAGASAGG
jgi:hypothetical protein